MADLSSRITELLGGLLLIITFYLLTQLLFSDPGLATISSVFVAILTGLYVIFTHELLQETSKQRKQDIQPAFAVDIHRDYVEVKNVGNGPALDTKLTLELIPLSNDAEDGKTETSNLDIPAGESIKFRQEPFGEFGTNLSHGELPDTDLCLQGNYLDMYENREKIRTRTYNLDPYREKQYPLERNRA
ncbi:hypothetical protein [Halorussus amylolyticus]|uniref:hypothetical protein n=1 Tax=Halorussus amylolyticus TaxID=1126242 RepID=UPI0010540F88|nr:hypothetical protein [Halorussus amylolyticus]